ncbi:uncharacterized protein LOC129950803 [Eupeodes corollae]|uniref:uncharacterized protein LOC129950803 n=1 Tax=Eupeodes corollae TaxID=290404 RepID=UPI00249280F9|nr:uncharacterized protein LOC129950803 [Eupeodes corollae]
MDLWTVEQLKAELLKRGLDTNGVKAVLFDRLKESDADFASKKGQQSNSGQQSLMNIPRGADGDSFRFSVRDVEGLISKFSGDDSLSIRSWFAEFEDVAVLLKWSELEKLIFARKQLTGSAQCFMKTCTCRSFNEFRTILCAEFEKTFCKADIYMRLQNRKMGKDESFREYVYKMKEIGQLADVDDISLITYIINGIGAREDHKLILYGARNFLELFEKYELFLKFKAKVGTSFGGGRSVGSSSGGVNGSGASSKNSGQGYGKMSRGAGSLHFFNCSSSEHQRKECRSPTKCFRCSGTGHMSNNCPSVKPKEANAFSVINLKQIYVNGIPFKALIDSGAEITLIRKDSFVKLADIDLGKEKVNLVGLGSGKHSTLGSFEANMMIDNVKLMGIMHVVPDNFIRVDAIIGRDVMAQAKVVMVDGETTFYGKEDGNFIMNIDLDEKNDIEVPIQYEPRVKELISSFTPKAVSHCPITMTIALSDETPIYSTPRRLPINEAEVVKKQVDEWSKSGIIRPSCSPFTSRVVVVKKKGGAFRVCIDYRGINELDFQYHLLRPFWIIWKTT